MSKILVVYGSTYRQTDRVAHRIVQVLKDAGHAVDAYQGDQLPDSVVMAEYDCFLLVAPVLRGHYQQDIRQLARWHAALLNQVPSAFVSVCSEAASDPRLAEKYIDALCRETGWYPEIARSFTGAVAGTPHGRLSRWLLKHMSRWSGLPTDEPRAWEFTDWHEVERFARSLASTWALTPTFGIGTTEQRSGQLDGRLNASSMASAASASGA